LPFVLLATKTTNPSFHSRGFAVETQQRNASVHSDPYATVVTQCAWGTFSN